MNARGIDTSHYNGDLSNIVHQPAVDFVIGQCTIGTTIDSHYTRDRAVTVAAGKMHAAYLYAVYGPGPTRQAKAFLAHAGDADWLMVDAEARGSGGLLQHPSTITAIIRNIRRLDPQKRKITLYSSRATQVQVGTHKASIWTIIDAQDANHVADYVGDPNRPGTSPRVPWLFWQTDDGNGKLDHDTYNGSISSLRHWAKGV